MDSTQQIFFPNRNLCIWAGSLSLDWAQFEFWYLNAFNNLYPQLNKMYLASLGKHGQQQQSGAVWWREMVQFSLALVAICFSSTTIVASPDINDEIKNVPWVLETGLLEQPLEPDSFPSADDILESGCDVGQVWQEHNISLHKAWCKQLISKSGVATSSLQKALRIAYEDTSRFSGIFWFSS